MSATPAEPTPAQEPADTTTPTPPAEIDWKAKSREWERKSKANAAAAEKLAELEEAQKTAEQKAAERLAAAEQKAAEAEFRASLASIAATAGVPADIAAGPKERTPEAVEAFVALAKEWAGGIKRQGNHVPSEGRTPTNPANDDIRAFARQLFERE